MAVFGEVAFPADADILYDFIFEKKGLYTKSLVP